MNSIIQQITDWLKGLLVSGIMNNLTNTFSSVNDQVGQIATEVGQTPSSFLPAVFNMVRNLSETVIMPIAGILLTFIACYELIQLIISYNNLASFETWFIFKWIFKTFVAVELITHTFDITMAVFDVSQSVVSRAGGIIQGSTAIDASTLATMQTTLEAMDLGPLLGIFLQSFVVQFLMYILAAIIFVIINGRMVEIYLMVSLAPIPFANIGVINNYIIPTIGDTKLSSINNHFLEKYYKELLEMPAVKGSRNKAGEEKISAATVNEIHKILRSCFRQAVKWGLMEKNPATDATVPKHKKQEREIWTAEMLMQALGACDNKLLKVAFHLCFTATLRLGELLGLTWDCMDISEEAIAENRSYIIINKEVERVSKKAVDDLHSKDIILIFPSMRNNNKTVRVLKTPKTESSIRRVYIPRSVALCLVDLKKEQEEVIEALGSEYQNYNLVMATTFGLPIGDSYLRDKMQKIIDELGLPDVVFHSLRHTSVTYKLKLSGGDIKSVQGDSGHAQADMVTEVYGHIIDEDRRKNAELMENAFYNKENLNPEMRGQVESNNTIAVPEGVDAELLMKVLTNPEMAALLTSLAKTMKV